MILQLSNISEYFYGLSESIYRAILDKFSIKKYIFDICDHAQSTGLRSSGSCRVAWSHMEFVYQTSHSKPSTMIIASADSWS